MSYKKKFTVLLTKSKIYKNNVNIECLSRCKSPVGEFGENIKHINIEVLKNKVNNFKLNLKLTKLDYEK